MLTIRGTAQDYQGDAADDWRATTAYRPPAPRPADPDQEILRPGNVAVASSVPLQLGGSLAFAITSGVWGTPDGAILTRVSGHQIGVPLALSFMARCRPRGGLLASQAVEVRLWDATTNQAIGSACEHQHDGSGRLPGRPACDLASAPRLRLDLSGAGARQSPGGDGVGRGAETGHVGVE